MRVLINSEKFDIQKTRVSLPATLKPKMVSYSETTGDDFRTFVSSQRPIINAWLIFSFISIAVLSVLLYVI